MRRVFNGDEIPGCREKNSVYSKKTMKYLPQPLTSQYVIVSAFTGKN